VRLSVKPSLFAELRRRNVFRAGALLRRHGRWRRASLNSVRPRACRTGRRALAPWDVTDLQVSLAPTSDGDGAMLGLVLVYAAILVVAVATILWKTLA